jgi:LuxR family maltose regulon positive regulatory protein
MFAGGACGVRGEAMAELSQVAVAAGRSLIIKRPRLTRLLDETTSRVILLVAPAGYGKTTLARQWLENRPHVWYRGSSASADVAALSEGLADSVGAIIPGAGEEVRERLEEATGTPAHDVDALTELVLKDLSSWPHEAVVALDDYHFVTGTPAAESLLGAIVRRSSARFLLTTRTRPAWVTARDLLYGDVFEIGRALLAMTPEEGGLVLSGRRRDEIPGLVALAEGWPAVLGLAARARDLELPDQSGGSALYDFFAEELFQDLSSDMQDAIARLALAPILTFPLASLLYGDSADHVIGEAVRLGVLTSQSGATLDLHPLLRAFLDRKLARTGSDLHPTLTGVVRFLIVERKWDEAFNLIERFEAHYLVVELVEAAMAALLSGGRLSTLTRWLAYSNEAEVRSPVLDLAEAEVAFREGIHAKAQALALAAEKQLYDSHLRSRALALAGECAYQLDHSSLALDLHRRAARRATTHADRRDAIWGQFLAAVQLEAPSAHELLKQVEDTHGSTAEGTLRIATGRLLVAATSDHVADVVEATRPVVHLVDRCSDAKIRTSFLSLFGSALAATAQYSDALQMVARAKHDADDRHLTFTLPFTLLVESTAALGLRDFVLAATLVDQCLSLASRKADTFLAMSASAARAKLLIANGAFADAVDATAEEWPHIPGPVVFGEFLGVRALALACAGAKDEAAAMAARAEGETRGVEARTLAACTRAILACQGNRAADAAVEAAFATSALTQNFDSLVTAVRGEPELAVRGVASEKHRVLLRTLLRRSNDFDLARSIGLAFPRKAPESDQVLSRREEDVFTLLRQGRTNREIAATLFVSEATVKVHVSRILKKLGVRSRTQAVLKATTRIESPG